MASTSSNTKHSRFSTFKVFKFTGSKPPPPPPKDANYVYSSSFNHSLLSFTHLTLRSIQPSPCGSASVCTLSPDQSPNKCKGGFFRKISGLRKRSASKNSRVANPDDTTDDEDISPPWNFQHHIHIDEAFQGIPPSWSSSLTELGYSPAEIALIQKGRRPFPPKSPPITPPSSQHVVDPAPELAPFISDNIKVAAAAPPPTPASMNVATPLEDAQPRRPVPEVPPAPVRPLQPSRSNSVSTTRSSRSRNCDQERRFIPQTPPHRPFRVVNDTSPPFNSPPPSYPDDGVKSGSPPPITLEDAIRPLPQEKAQPSRRLPDPPTLNKILASPPNSNEEAGAEAEQHALARNGSERRRQRPAVLSIQPPRLSLRKDMLEDLSLWSASLFSSMPSALVDTPESSASTAFTSASSPIVTLPSIVLNSNMFEEDEDEEEEETGEEVADELDFSYSASPLYLEVMGMMQDRAPSPTLDTAWSPSGASRDSQLTIQLDPRRDSNRDSSASTSTITHATIVRGASIVRRVRADVGKGRESERPPVQVVQEDDQEGDSSSDDASSNDSDDGDGTSGSTLALTTAPNSQEDAGGFKSPRMGYLDGSPLPSPSPSPLRASFPELGSGELEAKEIPGESPYVTPPPSAPGLPDHRPPIAVSTTSLSMPTKQIKQLENGISPPSFASTGAARYPAWLAAIVLPLAEFIDDAADPYVLFTELQEIAQGESGSVYSAHAAPSVVQQFRPLSPRSPAEDSTESASQLVDLRHELELTRALHHANVHRMERLYVDVAEESLWIGMELLDRSLADVLAAVGGEPEESAGAPIEISEKMVARFMWDVLLALSYIHKHHIAHRDVRSDNLLLSRSGVLKLADFSMAVSSSPGTPKRSDPVGVIYWQAPEMRTGLYDPLKVDVWSLGATAWELVHGNPPFQDIEDVRVIASHHQLPPAYFLRTACSRSEIVQLLEQCRAIDEQQVLTQNSEPDS
ncbi:hypothetical protein BGW80DRAFT_1343403 [Lactifluus volemus]|nr:hypothetical protein BGW80DRAFT_1343403 [Lactifluus volemus]